MLVGLFVCCRSFRSACFQLRIVLKSLQLLILESRVPIVEALVEQTFIRIRDLHSVR